MSIEQHGRSRSSRSADELGSVLEEGRLVEGVRPELDVGARPVDPQNLSGGMRPFASEVLSALAPTARAPTLLAITEQFMSEGLPSSPAQNSPSMFSDRIERTE